MNIKNIPDHKIWNVAGIILSVIGLIITINRFTQISINENEKMFTTCAFFLLYSIFLYRQSRYLVKKIKQEKN
jgi:membrane-bound ClpP family serine protease